ncbi:MAG: DUF2281 domain-containing protein [Thiotrichaceae bacterium]
MTDLDIITQLEAKIHQLPPQAAMEVNDYVDLLLQKYQSVNPSAETVGMPRGKLAAIFPRPLESLKPFSRNEIYE